MALIDKELSLSVVSHGQIALIVPLLEDLATHCGSLSLECLLTLNLPEDLPFDPGGFPFPVRIIRNARPLGFGANHNQAFRHSSGRYFCVLNPDIRLSSNPFGPLLECLRDPSVGLAAPQVRDMHGELEDSARRFPSPFRIICKALGGCRGGDYVIGDAIVHPEWVGGMFMLLPRERFSVLHGFDERYFLYYEDVDLCVRLRLQGLEVVLCPRATVIHHAQRSSHRNFRYLRWHLGSIVRFFLSAPYRQWGIRKWK